MQPVYLVLAISTWASLVFSFRKQSEGADRVERVDVTPSQIIIVTTKNGPIESLAIEIDLVDIETGERSTVYNLKGSMLLITRGRYTISFLKPSHWYGIAYRSSQTVNSVIYNEFKQQLLRTRDPDRKQPPFPVKVFDHRDQEGGKSLETLVVTSMWLTPAAERKNLQQALSEITFDCSTQEKKFDIALTENQTKHSFDVELENSVEIMERNENGRKVVGKITPKYCQRICFRTRLISQLASFTFISDSERQCHSLEPATAETTLRDYVSYDAGHGNLTILTDYQNATDEDYAVVSIEINDLKNSKQPLVASESFRTNSQVREFVLPALRANNLYAATYNYTKTSPFHFSENRQFIIEVGGAAGNNINNVTDDGPVALQFSTANVSGIRTPIAKLILNPAYNVSSVEVRTRNFCQDEFGHNVTLDKGDASHVLDLDLAEAICQQDSRRSFCPNGNLTSKPKCSRELCYGLVLHVNGVSHELQERCVDTTTHFPVEPSSKKATGAESSCTWVVITYVTILLSFIL
ncbi:hypothetical protein L596_004989 [Steinernema carpocapsae]|uniref:Uncharacterized protein n=1 Tax=Steinernema carpocapsae TaxID=34508 RepID=A0A4U8UZ51_STECR|nr:hypothetical protein L596_004989 [Steinernema carpocapsae]